MKTSNWILFLILLAAVASQAQSNDNVAVPDPGAAEWINQHFILLSKSRPFGYDFRVLNKPQYANANGNLICDGFAGKRLNVIKAEPATLPFQQGEYVVTLEEPDSGVQLCATTFKHQILDLAVESDLDLARKKWLHTVVYPRMPALAAYAARDSRTESVPIDLGEPVTVEDVRWGVDSFAPIELVVRNRQGVKGFISTRITWNNVYDDWKKGEPWSSDLWDGF